MVCKSSSRRLHARPSTPVRRVSRQEYWIQPQSRMWGARSFFAAKLHQGGRSFACLSPPVYTLPGQPMISLQQPALRWCLLPRHCDPRKANFLPRSCHGDSTRTSRHVGGGMESAMGRLLHGHGSSPLGFIKGGDASAWEGVVRYQPFAAAFLPFSSSLPHC